MTSNDEYVLQLLSEKGYLTAEQLDVASKTMREGNETTLDVLVASGALSEDDVLGTIADQFGIRYVNIDPDAIDPAVGKEITSEIAHKFGVVPVLKDDESLTVALSDPMGYDAVDSLRYVLHGLDVQAVLAPAAEVRAAMEKLYPTGADSVATRVDGDDSMIDVGEDATGDDAPVIRLATMIITNAIKQKASDIHLEPMEKTFRVRYRIDGALREMDSPPKRLQGAILSRIKIMSKMKISEKRIPQDGRIQIKVDGRDLDLRVNSVPTNHGESIVMRILDKSNLSLGLPQLGFLSDDQSKFERLIHLSDGVVLVTGPTGSGKTTTLYACLGQINTPDKKLITVEDPVEYQMSGINQVQVNRDVGLDFSAALRSILRQAPNIVMIGEIRDEETAGIAMEAALTGHLVFSTLHTNDAPSAVTRLTDMGVKSFLVASALRAAMALGIDRETILVSLLASHAQTAQFPISPSSPLYPAGLETPYVSSAYGAALDARVTGEPQPIALTLLVNEENSFKTALADFIAKALTDRYVTVTVSALPWADYVQALESRSFDLYLGEVRLTADWNLTPLVWTNGSLNYGGFSDAATETALTAFLADENETTAAALCAVLAQEAPLVPIVFKSVSTLTPAGRVEGLTPTQSQPLNGLASWVFRFD